MRLPGAQFPASLSRISKGGVIPERGDGERVVPSIFQPSILLVSPRNAGNVHVVDDTSHDLIGESRLGALGAQTNDSGLFNRGLWHLVGEVIFQFVGTTNVAAFADLQLISPAAAADTLARFYFITPSQMALRLDTWLSLPSDGWFFRWSDGATVALDALGTSFAFQMHKIL